MALDKLTKVQSVGISSFIQVVGVVTATGGFVGDLTGNVTGAATGDFSIADKIVHTGDTNTALRFPAADTFTVETGGSERFKVTDSLKEVKNGNLRITSTYIDFSGDVSTPATAAAIFRPADNTLAFSTGNNERLRITSSGLTVTGSTTVTEGLVLDGQNGSGKGLRLDLAGSSDYVIQETTTNDVVQFGGTGSSNFFTHNISSGSVGIATAVPSYRLDIGNGVNDPANGYQLRVNAAGDYIFALQRQSVPSFSIRNNSTGIVHLNTQNSKILSFGVSSGNASGSIEDDVRIDSNGHLEIRDGNLVIGTSGHGIDFSAAGNASGMSSELLDDYEEGTWTPTITGLGNHTNNAGSTWGKYTKIGNRVFITWRYQWTSRSTTNGGVVFLASLPFSAANDSKSDAVYIGGLEGIMSNTGREVYGGYKVPGTNTIQFRASGHNVSENSLFGSLSTSMSSGYIYGGANYIVG